MKRYFPIRPEKFIRGEKVFDFNCNGTRIEGFYKFDTDSGDYPYQVLYTEPDATVPSGLKFTLKEANNPCIFETAESGMAYLIREFDRSLFDKHNAWCVARAKADKESRKRKRKEA